MVIAYEKSNNKVLTMLVTVKQSTVYSFSILNSDFIILLLKRYFPTFYLEMLSKVAKNAQSWHMADLKSEDSVDKESWTKDIGPYTQLRGSSMNVPQAP